MLIQKSGFLSTWEVLVSKSNQKGIALIQVLLITTVLTILALYLTKTAKEQVNIAQWSEDKASALIKLHSAESELIFTLLTKSKSPYSDLENDLLGDISSKWNFFGKAFSLDDFIEIKIQDNAGLINAHYPDRERLMLLLNSYTGNLAESQKIVEQILDWQDLDKNVRANGFEGGKNYIVRNGIIPDLSDFYFLPSINLSILKIINENTTIHKQGYFNPTNSPELLLSALTSYDVAKKVIDLRENRLLTKSNFTDLTGIQENDGTFFYPSNTFSIAINSKVGESEITKEFTIKLSPYAIGNNLPVNVLSNRG